MASFTKCHFFLLPYKLCIFAFQFRIPFFTSQGCPQRAKKEVPDSPGLVDFAIGLVNTVHNLPNGQLKLLGKFKLQKKSNQSCWSIILGGLAEITFGLVHAGYNLPQWQAVKVTFVAPWSAYES